MGPRSASPVDAAGSPIGSVSSPLHSPAAAVAAAGNAVRAGGGVYDGMACGASPTAPSSLAQQFAAAGAPAQTNAVPSPGTAAQNELSKEFQKFTMVSRSSCILPFYPSCISSCIFRHYAPLCCFFSSFLRETRGERRKMRKRATSIPLLEDSFASLSPFRLHISGAEPSHLSVFLFLSSSLLRKCAVKYLFSFQYPISLALELWGASLVAPLYRNCVFVPYPLPYSPKPYRVRRPSETETCGRIV